MTVFQIEHLAVYASLPSFGDETWQFLAFTPQNRREDLNENTCVEGPRDKTI